MFKCAKRAHVQQWHMCSSGTCARFNSKLVRIRSVRGAMNCATTSQEDKGFNSKLVRLEGQARPMLRRLLACFNSKLVRLEGEDRPENVSEYNSFNSKLVRLEG